MSCDVLVVGGGPAGSATAIELARQGLEVLVLDAARFPRSKPCGDAVSPGAHPLLERLGALDALGREASGRIDGWDVRSPAGTWFESRFDPERGGSPATGLCIDRQALDMALLETARAAGARVLEGRRVFDLLDSDGRIDGVRVRGPDGSTDELRARFVVGADGLRSRVARRLGGVDRGSLRRIGVVGRWAGVSGLRRRGEMRISAEGVLGLAPLGGDTANLTVVIPADRAPAIAPDPIAFFLDRVRAYGLEERLRGARPVRELEVTGPFELTPRRRTAPGALLVGDAMGYLDPFTGQGVFQALDGARLAGLAIAKSLDEPAEEAAALARYEREMDRRLRIPRAVQRGLDFVVSRPTLIDGAARVLRTTPRIGSWLADVTGDRMRPRAYA